MRATVGTSLLQQGLRKFEMRVGSPGLVNDLKRRGECKPQPEPQRRRCFPRPSEEHVALTTSKEARLWEEGQERAWAFEKE